MLGSGTDDTGRSPFFRSSNRWPLASEPPVHVKKPRPTTQLPRRTKGSGRRPAFFSSGFHSKLDFLGMHAWWTTFGGGLKVGGSLALAVARAADFAASPYQSTGGAVVCGFSGAGGTGIAGGADRDTADSCDPADSGGISMAFTGVAGVARRARAGTGVISAGAGGSDGQMLTNCSVHAAGSGEWPRKVNTSHSNACASSATITAAARTPNGRSGRRISHQTRRRPRGSSSPKLAMASIGSARPTDAHCCAIAFRRRPAHVCANNTLGDPCNHWIDAHSSLRWAEPPLFH